MERQDYLFVSIGIVRDAVNLTIIVENLLLLNASERLTEVVLKPIIKLCKVGSPLLMNALYDIRN